MISTRLSPKFSKLSIWKHPEIKKPKTIILSDGSDNNNNVEKGLTWRVITMAQRPNKQIVLGDELEQLILLDESYEIQKIISCDTAKYITSGSIVSIVSIDEHRIATAYHQNNTIRIWALDSGKCLHNLQGHTQRVTSLLFLKSGELVSGSQDSTIRFWNIETGECTASINRQDKQPIYSLAPFGDDLIACGTRNSAIQSINIKSRQYVETLLPPREYVPTNIKWYEISNGYHIDKLISAPNPNKPEVLDLIASCRDGNIIIINSDLKRIELASPYLKANEEKQGTDSKIAVCGDYIIWTSNYFPLTILDRKKMELSKTITGIHGNQILVTSERDILIAHHNFDKQQVLMEVLPLDYLLRLPEKELSLQQLLDSTQIQQQRLEPRGP